MDDLDNLAKFAYIYADEIQNLKKENEFCSKYPNACNVFKNKLQKNMKFATCTEIANLKGEKKQTLFFTGSKAQSIELCRHLRNSFSHGLLSNQTQRLMIFDKDRGSYTSKGYLNYDDVKEFIKEVIKDYENNK